MSEWKKRKRLEAIINGEKPDRLPIALWRHWPGDDQDAAALAAAHIKWNKDYDWDLIKVSPASSYCLVDWGVKDSWDGAAEGTRTYVDRVVKQPEDWEKLTVLDPGKGMLGTQINALKLIGDDLARAGDNTPFIATIFLASSPGQEPSWKRTHGQSYAQSPRFVSAWPIDYRQKHNRLFGCSETDRYQRYLLCHSACPLCVHEPGRVSDLWLAL